MTTSWKPAGYTAVTPYLVVPDADAEITFLRETFDAQLRMRLDMPDGSVGHAELTIDDAPVMLGQAGGPHEPLPALVCVYVPDVDATFAKAKTAGAEVLREVTDEFYGDRVGMVKDTNGITWSIHTHREDVSEDELQRRMMDERE